MEMKRASGILLHPTSFPSPHGIGDLGKEAYEFVDFLVEAKQTLWQVLPLGPTGYGDSPYASFSSFAGNPLLIDLDRLIGDGDLEPADLDDMPDFGKDVDYGQVINWKFPLLEKAARNFIANASSEQKAQYESFWKEQFSWLDDFALFMAIKEEFDEKARQEEFGGAMWSNYWDKEIRLREPHAINRWREKKAETIAIKKILQFYFFQQWRDLRQYANERGIKIIGDIPIFVAADSVDVWANRELFLIDENGQPTAVAGVPPDYFSATGQLWGNPLYDWEAMQHNGFQWWLGRLKAMLNLVDIIRVDHFRGFEAYWKVPAGAETAIDGQWVKAPGHALFETIQRELGELPIIAEDLGVITPEVNALRDRFNFPGMKVLQFAFDSKAESLNPTNPFLPHNHVPRCVVYTGTHDNDTTTGWWNELQDSDRDMVRRYLARSNDAVVWSLIRVAMASVGSWTIIPLQDALMLGTEARMNRPSVLGGNWAWRYDPADLSNEISNMLREMVDLFGRDPAMWG